MRLDIHNLTTGIYLLSIESEKGTQTRNLLNISRSNSGEIQGSSGKSPQVFGKSREVVWAKSVYISYS